MRIISTYKDYYDGVVGTVGIDNSIVFNRVELEETFNKNIYTPARIYRSGRYGDNKDESYQFFFIGFCGKIYPVLQVNKYNSLTLISTEYIYDVETIKQHFLDCYNQRDKYTRSLHTWDKYISQLNDAYLLSLFQEKKLINFVIKSNVRYYSYENVTAELKGNVCLKDYSFFKLVDAFTAFNEISIFVGEQLNTEVDSTNMTDKQMVVSKGFDPVYGFRKRKNG